MRELSSQPARFSLPLAVPELPDGVLEPDGLWMRTGRGRTELKVIRSALLGDGAGRFWPLGGSD